jgi:hypothetical protein
MAGHVKTYRSSYTTPRSRRITTKVPRFPS